MTTKRFTLIIDSEWWIVEDNSIKSNKYRNDLEGDDAYRGLKEGELTEKEVVDLLNTLHEENKRLKFDKSNLHRAMSKEEVRHKQFKDKIFCQIDCKIKQLKDCYMVNEAKIIKDLKEELIWND